jgi:hypothetical protein
VLKPSPKVKISRRLINLAAQRGAVMDAVALDHLEDASLRMPEL